MTLARVKELVAAIDMEHTRIFGEDEFSGDEDEYAWLASVYGVTEAEDVYFMDIGFYTIADTIEDFLVNCGYDDGSFTAEEQQEFVSRAYDFTRSVPFLESLLKKFRSSDRKYPRE